MAKKAAKKTTRKKTASKAATKSKPAAGEAVPAAPVERVPLSQINPAPYNPSKPIEPGSGGYEKLKRSLERFGQVLPLVWNKQTGHLVGGHQALTVIRTEWPETTELPCQVVDLPADAEKALNVRLNTRATEDDPVRLGELLQELIDSDIDTALTGLDETAINQDIANMEAALEHQEKAQRSEGEGVGSGSSGGSSQSEDDQGSDKLASSYQVVIECESEDHQRQVYEWLRGQKLVCKLNTLY